MEENIFKIFISLGVPGLALGIFYMLFKKFEWKFPKVPSKWVGPIIVLFMILTFLIVFYALTLFSSSSTNNNSTKKSVNNKHSKHVENKKEGTNFENIKDSTIIMGDHNEVVKK